jgi:hypothetical protein
MKKSLLITDPKEYIDICDRMRRKMNGDKTAKNTSKEYHRWWYTSGYKQVGLWWDFEDHMGKKFHIDTIEDVHNITRGKIVVKKNVKVSRVDYKKIAQGGLDICTSVREFVEKNEHRGAKIIKVDDSCASTSYLTILPTIDGACMMFTPQLTNSPVAHLSDWNIKELINELRTVQKQIRKNKKDRKKQAIFP